MKTKPKIDTKLIGQRIKKLRTDRGLDQRQLGDVLGGLSNSQVSNLESGRRNLNIHQIRTLADYFSVTLETLGVETHDNVIETVDLLERAKLIFENEDISADEKTKLYESIMRLYIKSKDTLGE